MVNLIKIDCTELLSSHRTKYTNRAVFERFDTAFSTATTVYTLEMKFKYVVFIIHAIEIKLNPLSASVELIVQGVLSQLMMT